MANFDVAAGVTEAAIDGLIGQYYASPPAANDPFNGNQQQNFPGIGAVTISWNITASPTVTFGTPSQAAWDAALNAQGDTNKSAGTPLPQGDVVQVVIPAMSAHYAIPPANPIGGDTQNVIGYLTIVPSGNTITVTTVAITLDESSFSAWDKLVFNKGFLPHIFDAIAKIGSVIHIPDLTWHGIALNTPQFRFVGPLLIAAATQSTNPNPLDITGATWPSDEMFALASQGLLNDGIHSFIAPYVGKNFADHGEYKGLATWSYTAKVESITARISSTSPLTVGAAVSVDLQAGGGLTTAGMALAALGCAMGAALAI